MTKQLDIVIPVLNEEKTLHTQIEKLFNFLKDCHFDYKIIIADNGSKDGTKREAQKLITKYKNNITYLDVKIIGVGIALKTAWKRSTSQYLCFMDLDFSTSLNHLEEAHKLLVTNKYDCIYGSRLNKNSKVYNYKCPVAEDLLDNKYMGILLCSYDFKKLDAINIVKAFEKVWNKITYLK